MNKKGKWYEVFPLYLTLILIVITLLGYFLDLFVSSSFKYVYGFGIFFILIFGTWAFFTGVIFLIKRTERKKIAISSIIIGLIGLSILLYFVYSIFAIKNVTFEETVVKVQDFDGNPIPNLEVYSRYSCSGGFGFGHPSTKSYGDRPAKVTNENGEAIFPSLSVGYESLGISAKCTKVFDLSDHTNSLKSLESQEKFVLFNVSSLTLEEQRENYS